MKKKARRGRLIPKANQCFVLCPDCKHQMEFSAEARENCVVLSRLCFLMCPDCKTQVNALWVDRRFIIYTSDVPMWLFMAGHRQDMVPF